MSIRKTNRFLNEVVGVLSEEISKLKRADYALRGLFLARHYKGSIPAKDMERALDKKDWHKMYTKAALMKAWKNLVKDKFVVLKKGKWVKQ